MKRLNKAALFSTLIALGVTFSTVAYAGKIYQWYTTDEKGNKVQNYGETPPKGVQATLVSETSTPKRTNTPKAAEPLTDQQKQLRAKRSEECTAEKSRLATLQKSGSRIRMANPDGTSRYLSPEEIIQEIENSKAFLKDACS